jgi:hypothetical protein
LCTAVVGPGVPVLPLLQVSGAADQAHPLQGGQGQSQAGYSVFFLPVFFYSVFTVLLAAFEKKNGVKKEGNN